MSGWTTFIRQATALCLLLAIALAVVMMTVAHQVQGLEQELGSLRRAAVAERQKMHVLQAEFSFLAEPERLRRLARAHLGLMPIEPEQLASFATLDDALLAAAAAGAENPKPKSQMAMAKDRSRTAGRGVRVASREHSR